MPVSLPLLLIDIDGPLNPYAAKPERRPEGYTTHRMKPSVWVARHSPLPAALVRPLRVWLNPGHGPQLLSMPYELVWATTWQHEANTMVGPHLGLPELPVIEWPELFAHRADGTFWKTKEVVAWAAGRPFAWIDDEVTDIDRAYVSECHQGRALLHRIDPQVGMLAADFAVLAAWAATLSTP